MADKSHNYELAFHIMPNLEESRIGEIKLELESLITSKGAVISYSRVPEKTRLSYLVKDQRNAFFGYIHFTLPNPEESLAEVNEHLRRHGDILRYIILKTPSDLQKGRDMLKQLKMKERAERKPKAAPKAPVTEEEKKKLDEQLEDIIEKL